LLDNFENAFGTVSGPDFCPHGGSLLGGLHGESAVRK
jgi:hypothetical protein